MEAAHRRARSLHAGNVEWAKAQGFTNMILGSSARSTLNATSMSDSQIEEVKSTLAKHQMHVSALQVGGDSINPDMERRARSNDYFVKAIELAGKLGVPYIGTQSGRDAAKPFEQQIDEIVRVYHEKFFPACERYKVRILWEPYPEAPTWRPVRWASRRSSKHLATRPMWVYNTIPRT